MILASGNIRRFSGVSLKKASIKVTGPTLPANITKIRISLDILLATLLIPTEIPTVPIAETDSKTASMPLTEIFCVVI